MIDVVVILHNNSFTVYLNTPSKKVVINDMIKKFHTYTYVYDHKQKRKVKRLDKIYIGGNKYQNEYIFNIKYIKDFMWLLNIYNIGKDNIEIVKGDSFKTNKLSIKFNYDKYTLKDYQDSSFNKIVTANTGQNILIDHQTGFGKGIISISSVCRINKAIAILILPRYIEKWVEELIGTTDVRDEDIVVIKGGNDLRDYMNLALAEEYRTKIIIFSNRTISNYIKEYEKEEDLENFSYPVIPANLMETFGIGTLLIDEAHQEFYSVFKASLYFNVDHFIGMTATLKSADPTREKLHLSLFPTETRLSNLGHDRYIDLHPIRYRIENYNRITAVGTMGYSHIAFEQSIMRHSIQFRNYIKMIKHYVKVSYTDRKEDGDKLIIFAASIDLCTYLKNVMVELLPDLKIARYVEDDLYEDAMNADVIISTPGSSSTAFDIKSLISILSTISIKSLQTNIQLMGRLRKKDGKQMKYYYLYSKDIPKQDEYHKYRLDILKPRVKEIFLEEYKETI